MEDDKEKTVPGTEESDVEGHRHMPRADEETDEARRETDDDPDVEGHRFMPRTEVGRTEVGRTEVGRTETGRTEP